MNSTDYDKEKFDKDEYGNLIPREDEKEQDREAKLLEAAREVVSDLHNYGTVLQGDEFGDITPDSAIGRLMVALDAYATQ